MENTNLIPIKPDDVDVDDKSLKAPSTQPYQAQMSNAVSSTNIVNNNTNFIRRLFACGGYCARNSRLRTSSSNINNNNVSNFGSAYGMSKSTTMIQAKQHQTATATASSLSPISRSLSKNKLGQKSLDSSTSPRQPIDTYNNSAKNLHFNSQMSLNNHNSNAAFLFISPVFCLRIMIS